MTTSLSLRPVEWISSTKDDLRQMPAQVRDEFGYALYQAQLGKRHSAAKRLRGEFRGLVELVEDFDGDTYRAVYMVKLADVVYVLHVFQKKATHGARMPKHEIATIRARWQRARAHYAMHHQSTRRG